MINYLPCGCHDLDNAIRYFKNLTKPSPHSFARFAQSSFLHHIGPQSGNGNKLVSARATYFSLQPKDSLSIFNIAFMTFPIIHLED